MSCTCTYDYVQDGNVLLGTNRVMCAECTAAAQAAANASFNNDIKAQLVEIDAKSIRGLREGDTQRVADLEAQAVALRAQLIK